MIRARAAADASSRNAADDDPAWPADQAGRRMKRRRSKTQARIVTRANFSITREAQYVAERAIRHNSRIITLDSLVLFSTETGDAWMLDPADHPAVCLARDGSRLPVRIEETAQRFAIEWTHTYQIDGERMVFVDRGGHARMIWGYPTTEIEDAIQRVQR